MAGGYFSDDQNDKMKALLYPYLMDKARRRASQTSGDAYAAREAGYRQDEDNADARGLVSVLGDSASMAGTLEGKRSDVGQLPKYMDQLTANDQQRNANLFKERAAEEQSLGTDLGVARFVGDEDYKDKSLKAQKETRDADRQAKLDAALAAAKEKRDSEAHRDDQWQKTYDQRERMSGQRLTLDQGKLKLEQDRANRPAGAQGPGGIIPGYVDSDGNPITYNPKTGQQGSLKLPPGAKSTKPHASSDGKQMTSGSAQDLGSFDSALDMANQVEREYQRQASTTGSSVTSLIPGSDANQYLKNRDVAAQTIGIILEKGKLTDNDYARYKAMLPAPTDTNVIAKTKMDAIKNLIAAKKRGEVGGLGKAGFNTKGFANDPEMTQSAPPVSPGAPPPQKRVLKEFHSPSTGKVKRLYDDGTEEIIDGPR